VLAALLWFLSDRSAREEIGKIGENQSSSEARPKSGWPYLILLDYRSLRVSLDFQVSG